MGQGELHVQHSVRTQGGDGVLRIEDLHLTVGLDVAGSDDALAGGLDINGLGTLAVELGDDTLDVQDDLRHVLLDPGDGGELMLHTGDLDAGDGGPGQRGQKDPAKRVA